MIQTCNGQSWCKLVQDTKALMVQDTKAASLCGITSMLMWKDALDKERKKERKKERQRKGGAQLVVLMNMETVCWCFPPSHHYGYIRAIDRQRLVDNSGCHAECWLNRKRLQNICHRLS